jgi:hypothetical protein
MYKHGRMFHTFGMRETVNTTQMDIKRKTSDIRTWKTHLLLAISPTNIDTLVPSLYPCVFFFTVVPAISAPPFKLYVISETFATQL